VLRQLAEPPVLTEVAVALDQSPQRVYYHVKRLLEAGLVRQVSAGSGCARRGTGSAWATCWT
jgi:DNA-binding transcriptional ArsR family regulator